MIPNEEKYYTQALQRVDKAWRQYKHDLKKRYFIPNEKTIREICVYPPNEVSKNNWVYLVNYWNSDKGKVSFNYKNIAITTKSYVLVQYFLL